MPKMPTLPGMADFHGIVTHSTIHETTPDWRGKKVLVVGAGTSAHDLCAELHEAGCNITMLQRSSTYIMSLKYGSPIFFK